MLLAASQQWIAVHCPRLWPIKIDKKETNHFYRLVVRMRRNNAFHSCHNQSPYWWRSVWRLCIQNFRTDLPLSDQRLCLFDIDIGLNWTAWAWVCLPTRGHSSPQRREKKTMHVLWGTHFAITAISSKSHHHRHLINSKPFTYCEYRSNKQNRSLFQSNVWIAVHSFPTDAASKTIDTTKKPH